MVNDWTPGVDAPQNVVLISIPSVLDPSLAPPGKHVLHAYTPGTEPYALWEGLDRKSEVYRLLKAQRAEVLFLLTAPGTLSFWSIPKWKGCEWASASLSTAHTQPSENDTFFSSQIFHEYCLQKC